MISNSEPSDDSRLAELKDWLGHIDALSGNDLTPASTDASFRRYFRLSSEGKSVIAMDAPPSAEDCLPFVRISGYLEAMNLNAPRIMEADLESGFLLLSDLGKAQYLDCLRADENNAKQLYGDAIVALLAMQSRGTVYQASLPPYDADLLEFELSLFHSWLCEKHLGLEFTRAEEALWRDVGSLLVRNALDQPQVFVHRDYHSRNLMVTEKDNPGILDFQDAVEGPLTYDLVSLLKDCYIRWPVERVTNWAEIFYASLGEDQRMQVGAGQFMRNFELMGVQRHLKAAGIFARLNHRDGKTGYMADIPRTLSYIVELGPRYEELDFLVSLINERVLPMLEGDA